MQFYKNKANPVAWRPQANALHRDGDAFSEGRIRGRILLLVDDPGNRKQLGEQLKERYTLVKAQEGGLAETCFDLAVVDGPGFRRWHEELAAAKRMHQPVFLPVMLVLPRRELSKRSSTSLDLVDEFIIAPIDRTEFLERVALLLRTRQLAKEQQDELAHLITHDSVTGLPNQTLFVDRVHSALSDAAVTGQNLHVMVLLIPLERVMTSLGHDALNEAMLACATRFEGEIGDDFSLARLTSREWGILAKPGTSTDDMTELCRRLGMCLSKPIQLGRESVHLDVYFGISTYPTDATTAEELLNSALSAGSRAEVPFSPHFFSEEVRSQALRYIRTESKLHDALDRNQLELWFQPQFNLGDGAISGAEALVRWRLPSGEMVPPCDFIPVAETCGLIQRLDRWVAETACDVLAGWRDTYGWDLRVAVNLTPADLADDNFVPWIKWLLEQRALPPASLKLELTETMFCNTDQSVLKKLNELKEYGVTAAIDDFGTGYSSLSYLHKLPITILKVDKSFVDKVPGRDQSEGITEAIIGLAHRFDLEIVAEGIEYQEQLTYLEGLGVHSAQGFFLGRPMPVSEFTEFFKRKHCGR